jgi:hypothetical protein
LYDYHMEGLVIGVIMGGYLFRWRNGSNGLGVALFVCLLDTLFF